MKLVNRILSLWVIFLVISIILTKIPHMNIHFLGWFNYSLYFLITIISLNICRMDQYANDVFLNFAITYLGFSISIVTIFVGNKYFVGNNFLMYYMFVYRKIIMGSLLAFSILYLVIRYVLPNWPRWLSYLFSLLLILLMVLYRFWDFFLDKKHIFKVGIPGFYWHLLPLYVLPALALLLYAYLLFRYDRPNGMFISAFAMTLFIGLSFAIIDIFAKIGYINVYGIDQYFYTACLVVMAITLGLRLGVLHSETYLLRERFIFDPAFATFTPVITHDTKIPNVMKNIRSAFNRQYIPINSFMATSFIIIAALNKSLIVTIKLSMIVLWIALFWYLLNFLYERRLKYGQILNIRKRKQ